MALIRQSCFLGSYHYVRVEFTMGCPSRVSIRSMSSESLQPLLECAAEALGTVRLSCAVEVPCATVEYDLLP